MRGSGGLNEKSSSVFAAMNNVVGKKNGFDLIPKPLLLL